VTEGCDPRDMAPWNPLRRWVMRTLEFNAPVDSQVASGT